MTIRGPAVDAVGGWPDGHPRTRTRDGRYMHRRYWEWERPFSWDPPTTALLVVDMQRGFLAKGAPLEVPMAREQVAAIARVIAAFRERDLSVLYTRFVVKPDQFIPFYRAIAPQRGVNVSHDSPFASGGEDAAIVEELIPRPTEPVVDKVGYDGFADTPLELLLRSRGIQTLVLVGTVVNWCVDSTLRSAFHRRFDSMVLADGVSGYGHAGATGAQWVSQELDHFAEAFAVVMEADELVEALDDPALRRAGLRGHPPSQATDGRW